MSRYPIDLDVGCFLGNKIDIELLGDDSGTELVVDGIIAMLDSRQPLIGADENVPESIFLTTNSSYIKDFAELRIRISVTT